MCVHVCVSVKVLRHGFKVEVRVSGMVRVRMRNLVMYYESPHKDKNLRMCSYVLCGGHPSIVGHSSELLQA